MSGFKETKDLIDFLLAAVECWSKVYDDGSVDMTDIPDFWEIFMKIGPLIENSEMIPQEVKDLDAAELKELLKHIQDNLVIEDVDAQVLLDKLCVAMHAAYEVFMLVKAPEEEE